MQVEDLMKGIQIATLVVIVVVFSGFVIGSILTSDVFTSLTIINGTAVSNLFGEFAIGVLSFLGIIGIVLGVIWLIMYITKLFKKGGLNDLSQTA